MRAIILFCIVAIAFGQSPDGITISGANFQTQGVTTALQFTTRDKINAIGITNWLCHLATTKEIIGYQQGYGYGYQQRTPVYETQCAGMCLSIIDRPMSCQPRYKTILVYTDQYTYGIKKVSVIESCGCLGQQCMVVNKDTQIITTYPSGAIAYDSCEQKCTCSYGKLIDCCRQRKEFRTGMSSAERTRYLNTVLIASTTLPYKTQYTALIQLHQTYFSSGIHSNGRFLPWHRWYILQLENLLQTIDCRVTVPYWDWSLEASNPFASTIWGSGADALGGNGVGIGNCVTTGPFAYPGWSLPVSGGCLTRNFAPSSTFATVADIQAFITSNPNPTDYTTFEADIEGGPGMHNAVHCMIGGNMCSVKAGESIEFFLHHCFIDKIWADWQKTSPSLLYAYDQSLTAPMPGAGTSVPNDVMDLNAQFSAQNGQTVKVCYIDPPNFGWLNTILGSLSMVQLMAIPRTHVSSSIPWLKVMQAYMPMEVTNQTIAQQQLDENIRNGLTKYGNGARYNIVKTSDALACNCITSLIGLSLNDTVLSPLNGRLIAEGCPSDVPSVDPTSMLQATNVQCMTEVQNCCK